MSRGRIPMRGCASSIGRLARLASRGCTFALEPYARYDFDVSFDDPRMEAFWSKVDAAGLPVFFEISQIPDYDLPVRSRMFLS